MIARARALLMSLLLLLPSGAGAAADGASPEARVRAAIAAVCEDPGDGGDLARRLGDVELVADEEIVFRGRAVGRRWTLRLAEGGRLIVERIAPGGTTRRVSADLRRPGSQRPRPTLFALAGGDCRIARARRLTYDVEGRRAALLELAPDLETVRGREPLNPPVPAADGPPPTGPRVAIVDSGVNYTLPFVAARLARDSDGGLVGHDYWELDGRPFDGNPARSPYFPQRHGTETASVLLREAPTTALVPYRYPRPEMRRMADLVAHAAAAGVTVVAMPLGSRSESDWTAFAEAARAHPGMLFVVAAGNTGRDLGDSPIYPPVMELDNMLVVTSCTADGRLARGSSWSREHVDLMVPAESVPVTDWRGRTREAAGTSYAAPRLAALAARLLAANPGWRAAKLKAAILARAEPEPPGQPRVTRHGWIADPAADPPADPPADPSPE